MRAVMASALDRYWPQRADAVFALPVPSIASTAAGQMLPPPMTLVRLPEWADDLAADGGLLVPSCFTAAGGWQHVDWWSAAHWYLHGTAERAHELRHGPIHSYSLRLRGWDSRIWDRAWVNRIALLLRRWAARQAGQPESALFGPLPSPEIVITHDIDAVAKTWPIRLKQSAFHCFNALRCVLRGQLSMAVDRIMKAARMLLVPGHDWQVETTIALEREAGVRSQLNLFAGKRTPTLPRQWLLDPSYDVSNPALACYFQSLAAEGWQLGLHQSFDAWQEASCMRAERERLETACGTPVRSCRQHWLRFSWQHTWTAQHAAGFTLDTTLGFNDRPGFRNGAALKFAPLGDEAEYAALPLVLMDSHLYDYAVLDDSTRERAVYHWINEVRQVSGQCTVLWHPHTLSRDYGWTEGFRTLLAAITR